MVDFGESDKMIKISGKMIKSNTSNGFNSNISFFIQERTSSEKIFLDFFEFLKCSKIQKYFSLKNFFLE